MKNKADQSLADADFPLEMPASVTPFATIR
jgi:hypothetical protein